MGRGPEWGLGLEIRESLEFHLEWGRKEAAKGKGRCRDIGCELSSMCTDGGGTEMGGDTCKAQPSPGLG